MARFPTGAPERLTVLRTLRALAAASVALAVVSAAQAQTIGLRGKVEEEEIGAALHRASLANRGTTLAPKKKQKAEEPAPASAIAEEGTEGEQEPAADLESVFGDAPTDAAMSSGAMQTSPAVEEPDDRTRAVSRLDEATEEARAVSRMEAVEAQSGNERAQTENSRVDPLDNRDITADSNPYAAPGIALGAFVLKPTLEQGLNWTSSASNQSGPALFSETTLRLALESNWSRHSAALNAYGTWLQTIQGGAPSEPKAGVDGRLRLDLEGPWTADAALGWTLEREAADSAVPVPAGTSRPLVNQLNASVGAGKDEGKARGSVRLAVDRSSYGDATLGGGGILSQKERNQTLLTAKLRAGYEVSPALVPFVEGEFGRRIYDLRIDTAGYERSSTRMALRTGVELNRDEKLDGEIAVGWLRETFDDTRLAPISGLSVDATVNWSPVRETTIRLKGSTAVEGTTVAGKSGSLLYSGEIGATRQLRANLQVEGALQASLRDYSDGADRDTILAASAGFTWWLNRYLGVTGRVRHEMVDSTISGNSSKTTTAFIGIKLQR